MSAGCREGLVSTGCRVPGGGRRSVGLVGGVVGLVGGVVGLVGGVILLWPPSSVPPPPLSKTLFIFISTTIFFQNVFLKFGFAPDSVLATFDRRFLKFPPFVHLQLGNRKA